MHLKKRAFVETLDFLTTPGHMQADATAKPPGIAGKGPQLVITDKAGMARWRKILFAFLSRNARPANAFFQIPPNRVVEFGAQIEL